MAEKKTGRIVRSLSGFYDVETDAGVITCRGRGALRKAANYIPLDLYYLVDIVGLDIGIDRFRQASDNRIPQEQLLHGIMDSVWNGSLRRKTVG